MRGLCFRLNYDGICLNGGNSRLAFAGPLKLPLVDINPNRRLSGLLKAQ
jgi:hypothetical protein